MIARYSKLTGYVAKWCEDSTNKYHHCLHVNLVTVLLRCGIVCVGLSLISSSWPWSLSQALGSWSWSWDFGLFHVADTYIRTCMHAQLSIAQITSTCKYQYYFLLLMIFCLTGHFFQSYSSLSESKFLNWQSRTFYRPSACPANSIRALKDNL